MNLVDSCGWLEYFADGPNADFYAPALEDPGSLLVPTICLLEVFKRVLKQRGEDAALQAAAAMHQGLLVPLDATSELLGPPESAMISSCLWRTASFWPPPRLTPGLSGLEDAHFKGLEGVRYTGKR